MLENSKLGNCSSRIQIQIRYILCESQKACTTAFLDGEWSTTFSVQSYGWGFCFSGTDSYCTYSNLATNLDDYTVLVKIRTRIRILAAPEHICGTLNI
jgi:hypothetical protein